MRRTLIGALVALGWAAASVASAASGTLLRDEKLLAQPSAKASVTASVMRGTSVTILSREGGWLHVSAGKSTGWVRLLSVRAGAGGLGGPGIGDVVGAATTRSDPTRVVAVAGLRGLNDEQLKQAQFNAEELMRMEAQGVTAAQASGFAGQSGLAAIRVADLPKPKAEPSPWGER